MVMVVRGELSVLEACWFLDTFCAWLDMVLLIMAFSTMIYTIGLAGRILTSPLGVVGGCLLYFCEVQDCEIWGRADDASWISNSGI